MHRQFRYMEQVGEKTDPRVAQRIIKDVFKHMQDHRVVTTGLIALWVIGYNEKNRKKLMDIGAGKCCIISMQNHRKNREVLASALNLIKHLTGNLYDFVKRGAGSELMSAMNLFPNDANIQVTACGAIRHLSSSRPNAELLVEWDVGILILTAMRKHKSNVKVQKSACAAVWALLLTHENKDKLWRIGLCHFVIEAMRTHRENERIQEYGTGALWTFEYKYCMMHLGSSDVALTAMKMFGTNARIVEHGFGLIRNLAALEVNAKGLMEQDAANVIINSLQYHKDSGRVQGKACIAIWSLSLWDCVKADLMNQGVGDAMCRLLKRFKQHPGVLENAIGVIANLSTVRENAKRLFHLGAGAGIITGARSHSRNESIQAKAICALMNISYWEDQHAAWLRDNGGASVVESAMRHFPQNENIRRHGDKILQRLGKVF